MKLSLVGLLGVGVGVVVALLLSTPKPRKSEEKPGTAATPVDAKAAPVAKQPKKKLVESRSQALEWEQLQALGYVDGTYDPNIERANVLVHDADVAQPGYNFYNSQGDTGARLLRMDGTTVYEWQTEQKGEWQHLELLPNGDVLVIVKDKRLSRYDARSRLLWSVKGRFHHDLWVHDDRIYVLTRTVEKVEAIHPKTLAFVDAISVVTMDGKLEREISILAALRRSGYGYLLPSVTHKPFSKGRALDVLHTNHVEILDGSSEARGPLYARGNFLISMRNINAIAILDARTADVVWLWGPTNLTFQHHPTMLDNGHILLFDNGTKQSRVIEIDPPSGRIVWEYAAGESFFSATRGSNQRLMNGNTLITESDRGYVFEVTREGDVVWKFANPAVSKKKKTRHAIWRMTRVDPETLAFLD